jgi:hypothetical protein
MWRFINGASLTSSELLITEAPRALRRPPEKGTVFDPALSLQQADILLGMVDLRSIKRVTVWRAGRIFEPRLRSLDAIHVVAALELRPIEAFVSYDERQLAAAHAAGLRTVSPGIRR